jgi:TusA-related sulfurtransferase
MMSNSSLVSYTRISPNKTSPRKNKIDTITIHCVVGQLSVETLGNVFASTSRQASSNYGIGPDGRVGMYVEEKDRSWCTSSSANDNRAITIEVASDTTHPYKVTAAAYEALIKLCADICKRNDIKELKWKGDKSLIGQVDKQNMTVHRWFANKSCPGDYLYNLHGDIANRVNKLLNPTPEKPSTEKVLYRVQTGAFSNKAYADALEAKVKKAGFDTYMVKVGNLYKVQVGAFGVKANADAMANKLKAAGFDTYITTESGTPVQNEIKAPTLKIGSKVKVIGTKYATGQNIPAFVKKNTYTVQQIDSNKVLLKEIISWVYVKDIQIIE